MHPLSPGSRIINYDTLVKSVQEAYAEYMKRSKEFDKLEGILEKLYE